MKNIKERIGYFGKMILVFPEVFLAKLTKPKSRGKFDDAASAASGLSLVVFSLLLAILFFVNLITNFGGKNNVGFFSDGILSGYQVFFLCLFLFVAFLVKTLFFTGRSYFDFLSECTLREKKETMLFDNEGKQNVSEVIIVRFPKKYQKEESDKDNEMSTKEIITNLKANRFRGRKGKVILKKGKAESRKNVDDISIDKIYANDDVEKFSQKARYRIKKVELLKETTIFNLWNMEYKKESRQLLVTVEGNIAEEVLEELKAKAVVQEELDSMLN